MTEKVFYALMTPLAWCVYQLASGEDDAWFIAGLFAAPAIFVYLSLCFPVFVVCLAVDKIRGKL